MPRLRSRSAVLAVVGVLLALLAGALGVMAGAAPTSPRAVSQRAISHRTLRDGRTGSIGDVLLEPDLFHAMVTGAEPVDPHDTVGSAIISGRLLFIGASYSLGLGATGRDDSFPELLAERFGDPYRVDAVAGSGFQNPGPHHQGTFAERLQRDSDAPPPRIVVIQGGRDDLRYPLDREYGAALDTIQLAQHRFDEAQVVVLGPIPARLPVPSRLLAINDAIERACANAHAGFINPIAEGWITGENERSFASRIIGHPNDAGYAYITTRLREELPAALATSARPLDPDGT